MTTTGPDRHPRLPYQPGLDGVRGLAVLGVLLFHAGVAVLPGGFLGVDAFFVLSGFLITALLLGERDRTGRVDLVAFWARRARRLLPALLVLLVTVVLVSRWLLPVEELPALRGDLLAALAYVANWRMADRGGDYFAATAAPSPLRHTWSLGIEEQFYLLWPLLLVAVLALRLRRRGPAAPDRRATDRRRWALLGLCVVGAVTSAVTAALLFRPDDVNRAYYGTDTRAVALLVGCATAILVRHAGRDGRRDAGPEGRQDAGPAGRIRHPVLGGLALAGAATTAVLWTTSAGGASWLYRGGLTLAALAVAALVAHVVVSPGGPSARLLAVPPLVGVGRISYGLYLWHWPLYGWLNADRTGLAGPALLGLRLGATLLVALVSYRLVERPVRSGRWPWRQPRLAPALAACAVVAVAGTAVTVTRTPAPSAPPAVALDGALATPSAGSGGGRAGTERSPMRRPGRRAGAQPRVAFFGDSVSWSLGTYLPAQEQLRVTVRAVQGCGIARLPELRYIGEAHPNYPGCEHWDTRWRRHVDGDDPDVAVILLDRWELMDRRLDGRYQHVGEPAFDAYLNRELDRAISVVTARGAHVVLLTAPYTRRAERPDGGLWPEDEPSRVDAWNTLLRAAGQRHRASVLDLNRLVCPGGRFAWSLGGIRVRSDGLHFTPDGVRRFVAPWLLPELARLATHGG